MHSDDRWQMFVGFYGCELSDMFSCHVLVGCCLSVFWKIAMNNIPSSENTLSSLKIHWSGHILEALCAALPQWVQCSLQLNHFLWASVWCILGTCWIYIQNSSLWMQEYLAGYIWSHELLCSWKTAANEWFGATCSTSIMYYVRCSS